MTDDPFRRPRIRASESTRQAARDLRQQMTPAETVLWQRLRRRQLDGWYFRRQHVAGPYIIDFFCAKAKLVVEVDGGIHNQQVEYDVERTEWLASEKGCRVIRFKNGEVLGNIDGVLERILLALNGCED